MTVSFVAERSVEIKERVGCEEEEEEGGYEWKDESLATVPE